MVVPRLTAHTRVSFLPLRTNAHAHELATHRAVAQQLAALLECEFIADAPHLQNAYVVPDDTITSLRAAQGHGIRGEDDLFGGVVPWPYMAGKTISHPLLRPSAAAPEGWCPEFPLRVRDAVLPGYSVFSLKDARLAVQSLLRDGPVRLKLASGSGGGGQTVIVDKTRLESVLAELRENDLRQGLVVEPNLAQVRTFSVGWLRVGPLLASYVGEQRTTPNRDGNEVYGGSELSLARGDFDRLRALVKDANMQRAIGLAQHYHCAALELLQGMYASRCNYDVAYGVDAQEERMGVLEQSWRIGGASGAEVAGLQAFANDASLQFVRSSTVEEYDTGVEVPEGATISFRGIDPP